MGARFLATLDEFIALCVNLRDALDAADAGAASPDRDDRIWFALKLLRFLRENSGGRLLYIKYAHMLANLHLAVQNHVEAALAYKLHADILPWSHATVVQALPEYGFPHLYNLAIESLERADHWERALMLSHELAVQYERDWYDYAKYAGALRSQARYAESIVVRERFHPNYFRVGFYGRGFAQPVRNKQFVYRGDEWENITSFCERMLNMYVGAQLLRTNVPPGDDIREGAGRWMQITSVNPEIDYGRWASPSTTGAWLNWEPPIEDSDTGFVTRSINQTAFFDRERPPASSAPPSSRLLPSDYPVEPELDPAFEPIFARAMAAINRVPEAVKDYYLHNEVNIFSFSRPVKLAPVVPVPRDDPAREFLELWTEKTLLVTADSFPCLARRSEVVQVVRARLSPVQNAVVAVRLKNRQLRDFERKYESVATRPGAAASAGSSHTATADHNHHQQHHGHHGHHHHGGHGTASSAQSAAGTVSRRSGSGGAAGSINLFTMALNGAVDAPVNGGVPMYRRAFLADSYRAARPGDAATVDALERAIDDQVEIVHRCLAIHDAIVPAEMRPLHESLVAFFHKNFASEIARLGLSRNGRITRSKFSSRDWIGLDSASSLLDSAETSVQDVYSLYPPAAPPGPRLAASASSSSLAAAAASPLPDRSRAPSAAAAAPPAPLSPYDVATLTRHTAGATAALAGRLRPDSMGPSVPTPSASSSASSSSSSAAASASSTSHAALSLAPASPPTSAYLAQLALGLVAPLQPSVAAAIDGGGISPAAAAAASKRTSVASSAASSFRAVTAGPGADDPAAKAAGFAKLFEKW
ncbi:hypothetical protein HK405_009755 [Cladochytrium tenue]|nr:hypothetical protein HK405_009755 [Cladochytrium tenue]